MDGLSKRRDSTMSTISAETMESGSGGVEPAKGQVVDPTKSLGAGMKAVQHLVNLQTAVSSLMWCEQQALSLHEEVDRIKERLKRSPYIVIYTNNSCLLPT